MPYPVTLRITERAKGELAHSEFGSWEDSSEADREHHAVTICRNSPRGRLVVHNVQQADALLYALSTGTFGLRDKGFLPTCRRLYEELAPFASAEARRQCRYPDGY